jgi:uncharacterized lipoprotein YmbA
MSRPMPSSSRSIIAIQSGRIARQGVLCLTAALLLAGCGSTPTRYYTLLPPPGSAAAAPGQALNGAVYQIDVQPVSLPPQVTTPQLVVRTGDGEMVPVDTRRWIAPLDEEFRGALAASLSSRLGVRDVHGLPGGLAAGPGVLPTWRVGVTVQRFESALGSAARLDALWSLRLVSDNTAALTCVSHINESVQPGYDALVAGHQRAVADLAGQIGGSIDAARRGHAECPRF